MWTHENLFLHDEILLLALRDKEGTVDSMPSYQYALGGAILAELLLEKRIETDGSKKKRVSVRSKEPCCDPLVDECFQMIKNAKKAASLETWISKFAGIKDLKHRVALKLCKRGILRADEDKVLLLFTRKIYPEVNPEPEQKLIRSLREAVLADSAEVDPRTAVLLSLAKATNLLKMVFTKKELKERKSRIEQIVQGEALGKAAKEAVEAVQAAIFVACVMPAITTTVTS